MFLGIFFNSKIIIFLLFSENSQLRGNRYIVDDDEEMILIYDVNGYIAGIQAGVSS